MLNLDSETWAKLYLSTMDLEAAIDSKSVTLKKGKNKEIVEILNMFDRFQPAQNVTVPPLDDMTHLIRQ